MEFLVQPNSEVRLGEHLLEQLNTPEWTEFRAAVAFVKRSGTQHLSAALEAFDNRAAVRISVGIDLHGTSREGLEDLLHSLPHGEVWVFHNNNVRSTFHPKLYLFKNDEQAMLILASGNWTQGGLFTNYEAAAVILLNRGLAEDTAVLAVIENTLDSWSHEQQGLCHRLTGQFLEQLVQSDLVRTEAQINAIAAAVAQPAPPADPGAPAPAEAAPLFSHVAVPGPPAILAQAAAQAAPAGNVEPVEISPGAEPTFVLSVLDGDLPQAGSSNEIRITKGIRNADPTFWEWPESFEGPHPTTGQYHRDVTIRMGNNVFNGYLKDFPGHKPDGTKASADFRMGSIAPIVQALHEEEDLVVLTRSSTEGIDFEAQVIRTGDPSYEEFADGLIQHTRARSTTTGTFKKYKYQP